MANRSIRILILGSARTLFSWAWKSYYPKSHYSNRRTDPYLKYVYSLSLSNGNNRNGIAVTIATHHGIIPIDIAMISIDITKSNMYMLMFGLICSFNFKTKSRSCSPSATRSAPGSGYRLFKYFPFGRFRIWHGLRLPVSLRSLLVFGLGLTFLLIYIYII